MLLMLAAGQGAVSPPTGPLPDPLDAVVASIRPTGRLLATYKVPGTHATPDVAITAAQQLQSTTGKGSGVAWNSNAGIDELGPDFRVDTVLSEGSWQGDLGTGSYTNLYGQGPAKTELWSNTIGSGGTVHLWGPMHFEGIRIRNEKGSDNTGPKYPVHITVSRGTTTFADVEFLAHASLVGDASPIAAGMDGGPDTFILFYKCKFESPAILNLHGGSSNTKPLTVVFVECTGSAPLGYSDVGAGTADEVYIIDCTNPSATITGPNVKTYVKGFSGAVTASNIQPTSSWPKPVNGLSSKDTAFFTPSKIGQIGSWSPSVSDATAMTPVAGRTYYVPIPITDACHVNRVGFEASQAGGSYIATMLHGKPLPAIGKLTPNMSVIAGKQDWAYYYPRTYYPGETIAWVQIAFTDTARPLGSASLPGNLPCWYTDDGTTLVRASTGSPFPLAYIKAV